MPTDADNICEQQRCDDLDALVAARPRRFGVRPILRHCADARLVGSVWLCLGCGEPINFNESYHSCRDDAITLRAQLAESDRTIQRLHDAALEMQDRHAQLHEQATRVFVENAEQRTETARLTAERDAARRWAAAWRRMACALFRWGQLPTWVREITDDESTPRESIHTGDFYGRQRRRAASATHDA
jgi:hypothetical protein